MKGFSEPSNGVAVIGHGGPVTIWDVAQEAHVSPATVSRVMNRTAVVRPETRARVEAAIERLDFHPNDLAVGLLRRGSGMVGLIIPDLANPFWVEVALGAEATLRGQGYGLIVTSTGDLATQELEAISMLRRKRADGLLVAALHDPSESLHRAQAAGIPIVLLSGGADDGSFDFVTVDSVRGTYLTTEHLLQIGHRRIGLIGGPPDEEATVRRRTGYHQALADSRVQGEASWIAEGPGWGSEAGQARARDLLERDESLTAIVAANDVLAVGAWRALEELGLRVPEDLSLTGFDDIDLACLLKPGLTTVAQPRAEIGRVATEILLERLRARSGATNGDQSNHPAAAGPAAAYAPRRVIFEPRLVVRGSTRALPVVQTDSR